MTIAVLIAAICAVSTSAVMVRGIEDASPIAIAAFRTLGAALILSPSLWKSRVAVKELPMGWVALAGLCLALHFSTWFASLDYTTVMRSTVMAALMPVWLGLIEWRTEGQRPALGFWLGIGIGIVGIGVMAAPSAATPQDIGLASMMFGDFLATIAGVLSSLYLLIGRRIRQNIGLSPYMALVCFWAAGFLIPLAIFTHTPLTGFSTKTYWLLLGILALPQMVGHNGFNFAVKYIRASAISTLILLEPIGASLLAAVFLHEYPTLLGVVGAGIIVAGVMVAQRTQDK